MDTLKMIIDKLVFEIDLSETTSPNTLEVLRTFLPFRTELHYAKILGEEVMCMAPFNMPLEREIEMSQVKPGMLAYWPHRQLICLYYGTMQEETAYINVLGYLKSDIAQFKNYGERIREHQGKKLYNCDFYLEPPCGEVQPACPKHSFLDGLEKEIWCEIPREIANMQGKSGVMRPAGPILYAETDTRIFHEFLDLVGNSIPSDSRNFVFFKETLDNFVAYFYEKMTGWYGLRHTAAVVERYREAFRKCKSTSTLRSLINALTLFIGRINMWLDTLIPWNDINENLKNNILDSTH